MWRGHGGHHPAAFFPSMRSVGQFATGALWASGDIPEHWRRRARLPLDTLAVQSVRGDPGAGVAPCAAEA